MSKRDEFKPVADEVFYDDDQQPVVDFGDTVQDALDFIKTKVAISASPGFSFGKSGQVNTNAWLWRVGDVPSNRSGINVGITNPSVVRVSVGSENLDTYDLSIYQHDGDEVGLVLIGTVSITASRKEVFTVAWNLTADRHLAARITSGSARNLGVDLQLQGDALA